MKTIVGIDEVGRGPLAGPVTVCAVACESKLYTKLKRSKNLPPLGKDSKKLSSSDREKYAEYLKYIGVPYAVINVSNKVIDRRGITWAITKATSDGFKKIEKTFSHSQECENVSDSVRVLLDGGLKAPSRFKNQKTIIKGDEKEKIIAWASILAKVSRDALMCRLAKKYPRYCFELHKGYGTRKHREALTKHGLSEVHRRTFCKNLKLKSTK
jgi:ribonuclease HII